MLHISITTAPSKANNPELATIRPAPFEFEEGELPATDAVAVAPLLVPLAALLVAADPEAEAVLEPNSCAEEKVTQLEDAGIRG